MSFDETIVGEEEGQPWPSYADARIGLIAFARSISTVAFPFQGQRDSALDALTQA